MGRELNTVAAIAALIAVIGVSGSVGYWWAQKKNSATLPAINSNNTSRNVLYWYDPMVPNQHFDKPGKSPFMDMQLVPRYSDKKSVDEKHADEHSESNGIRVDTNTQQTLGVRIAPVERRALASAITAAGAIGFNEREIAIVQARTNGFVSRVYARAPGDVIARGAPLVDVLVPEWAGAQQEFIALRSSGDAALLDAARERLQLLGMSADVVQRIEQSGKPQTIVTISAPIAGVIQSLDIREGMTISAGTTLAQINALQTVWLTAAIPETLGAMIKTGDALIATIPALGNTSLEGRVIAVLPQTDSANRTLTVRAELQNTEGKLRPGQYARVQLQATDASNVIVVPSEALIRSGTRIVVIVAEGESFIPTEVQIGREHNGLTEIRDGLREGQRVVVSGQFLIDSEANLSGVLARMNSDSNPAQGSHP